MTKEKLESSILIIDAHSQERRHQHAEIISSLDKDIKNLKVQLWLWVAVIAISAFGIVETVFSLIN
jgi:hypothetical protein